MSCTEVMLKDPILLRPDTTIKEIFPIIRKIGKRYLPVVDENNNYIGVFSSLILISMLLPKSVQVQFGKSNLDLSFMTTNLQELKEKLKEHANDKIKDHISINAVPTCTPRTTILQAINLLYRHQNHVVVLEENSKQFVGVITVKSIYKHIESA